MSLTLDGGQLLDRLGDAVSRVAADNPKLWKYQAGERAIVGQVFFELRSMQWPPRFAVDTEWDREGKGGKRKGRSADLSAIPPPSGKGSAQPDIVVHVRGEPGHRNNLLIAEFKRQPLASTEVEGDKAKVVDLMVRYGYKAGAVVSLGDGDQPRRIDCLWYTDPEVEPERYVLVGERSDMYRGDDCAQRGQPP